MSDKSTSTKSLFGAFFIRKAMSAYVISGAIRAVVECTVTVDFHAYSSLCKS